MNFAQSLLKTLLSGLNLWQVAFFVYKTQGAEAAKRMITPPESFVRAVTKSTGADFAEAMNERDEAVEENLEFLESLVDQDFEDPEAHEVL